MPTGFNHFDIVYYINLKHRDDRNEHIQSELHSTGIDKNKIHRIDAVYHKDFGALGCSKSHITAIEMFLNTSDDIKNCLILEDDFSIKYPIHLVNDILDKFFSSEIDYDVLMVSANICECENTNDAFVKKIISAQTTSGYCVNKRYAPILLQNFKDGYKLLEEAGIQVHDFCIDIFWKQIQREHKWFCTYPVIGEQMESYSDIEKKITYYRC